MLYNRDKAGFSRLYDWLGEALDLLGIGGIAVTDTLQVLEVFSVFWPCPGRKQEGQT